MCIKDVIDRNMLLSLTCRCCGMSLSKACLAEVSVVQGGTRYQLFEKVFFTHLTLLCDTTGEGLSLFVVKTVRIKVANFRKGFFYSPDFVVAYHWRKSVSLEG
jgi:hypothetical protein